MPEYEYVGDGRPDGTIVGRTSTEKVGFFGTTPVAQQSAVTAVTTTITTTLATNTVLETDLTATITAVNSVITALSNLGLTA